MKKNKKYTYGNSIKINDDIYNELVKLKKETGATIKYSIEQAVRKYLGK